MAETISKKNIIFQVKLDTTDIKKGVSQIEKSTKKAQKGIDSFTKSIKGVGAALGIAFGTAALVRFGVQAIKVAAQAEGIVNAFKRLNDPNLLNDLRKAVNGTVGDIDLMRAAVQAKNFKIPLENLAKFFKFASDRARDTGESVDFLVDSIVKGIGRKSPLILDNLGLNVREINAEFAKTGDFAQAAANVIEREMLSSGESVETAADQIQRLNVQWDNFVGGVGKILLSVLEIGKAEDNLATSVAEAAEALDVQNKGFIEAFLTEDKLTKKGEELIKQFKELRDEEKRVELQNLILAQSFVGAAVATVLTEEEMLKFDVILQRMTANIVPTAVSLGDMEIELKLLQARLRELTPETEAFNTQMAKIEELQKKIDAALGKTNDSMKTQEEFVKRLTEAFEGWSRVLEEQVAEGLQFTTEEILNTLSAAEKLEKVLKEAFTQGFEVPDEEFPEEDADLQRRIDFTNDLASAEQELLETRVGAAQAGLQIISQLAGESAAAQRALLIFEKLTGIAQVIIRGVQEVAVINATFASVPPVAAALTTAARIRTGIGVATIIATAIPQIAGLAEGEIDIQGGIRGKDSIPAVLMPGESIMTTEETGKHKPLLEAIRSGNLDDYLYKAYLSPTILNQVSGFDSKQTPGYNDYQLRLAVGKKQQRSLDRETIRAIGREVGGNIKRRYR